MRDIKDDKFWKCCYIVLHAVFPAPKLLRYCDKSTPAMDKIFYLSHRTTIALEKSEEFLNDEALFGDMPNSCLLNRERSVLGGDSDDDDSDDVLFSNDDSDDDDNGEINSEQPKSFGRLFIWHWNKRKLRIEHEYAIAGWALCVMDDIRKDVLLRMTGVHQSAIDKVVARLHAPPCANTNPAISSMLIPEILDTFWNEFKAFQQRLYPFDAASCWLSVDIVNGNSYLWHEKYSMRTTKVLGYVACRVTSKLCGIGAAERSWGGVKQIKTGKRSHLSGTSTEKRSILFVSAKVTHSRIKSDQLEGLDARGDTFGDDDINFNSQLEKFGVDMAALKNVPIQRIFCAWVEDWRKRQGRRTTVSLRPSCLQSTKVLFFAIQIRIWHLKCGSKTWSSGEEEEMVVGT